jgi:hypothetical protein
MGRFISSINMNKHETRTPKEGAGRCRFAVRFYPYRLWRPEDRHIHAQPQGDPPAISAEQTAAADRRYISANTGS